MKNFFPRFQVKTNAQMQTGVKLLGGIQSNYWEDTVKLLGGYIPLSPPGFGSPVYANKTTTDSLKLT